MPSLRKYAGERRATIAPVFPGIVRPILVAGALSSRRVESEGLEELRIPFRRIRLRESISLVALGEARQRIRFAGIRTFLIPRPCFGGVGLNATPAAASRAPAIHIRKDDPA